MVTAASGSTLSTSSASRSRSSPWTSGCSASTSEEPGRGILHHGTRGSHPCAVDHRQSVVPSEPCSTRELVDDDAEAGGASHPEDLVQDFDDDPGAVRPSSSTRRCCSSSQYARQLQERTVVDLEPVGTGREGRGEATLSC